MKKISVAIQGFGNIGKALLEALSVTEDMECLGLIRRNGAKGLREEKIAQNIMTYSSIEELEQKSEKKTDVVLLSLPSKLVPQVALDYAQKGYSTVDSFDIHSQIPELVTSLDVVCKKNGTVAINGAGWDPGTDSVLRVLFEAMAPQGLSFTNFGPGRSMGHSVAARSIAGVADAISITMPLGGGRHARIVYVLLEEGAKQEDVRQKIKADSYFAHDDLDVRFVASAANFASLADNSHGVLLERYGASGVRSNQHFQFSMRIDNPALTSQVMVVAARAASRLSPGSYTLIDIPPVNLLPGNRLTHIAQFV